MASQEELLNSILAELKLQNQARLKEASQFKPVTARTIGPISVVDNTSVQLIALPSPLKGIWWQKATDPTDTVYLVTDSDSDGSQRNAIPLVPGQTIEFDSPKANAWIGFGGNVSATLPKDKIFPDSYSNAGQGTFVCYLDGAIRTNRFSLSKGTPANFTEVTGDYIFSRSLDLTDTRAAFPGPSTYLNPATFTIWNPGPENVYVGGSTVTYNTNGILLLPSEKMKISNLAPLYGVCETGKTQTVRIMEEGFL